MNEHDDYIEIFGRHIYRFLTRNFALPATFHVPTR